MRRKESRACGRRTVLCLIQFPAAASLFFGSGAASSPALACAACHGACCRGALPCSRPAATSISILGAREASFAMAFFKSCTVGAQRVLREGATRDRLPQRQFYVN